MDKQEIIDEINKTKEYLANLEMMLKDCESERWKPEDDDIYYYISEVCTVIKSRAWAHCIVDEHYHCFNCFRTEEEAEAEAEKILVRRQLEDIARRLNKGRKIDWSNENQYKWYFVYDTTFGFATYSVSSITAQGVIYCLDKNFLNTAIKEIGEGRLIKYLRGK